MFTIFRAPPRITEKLPTTGVQVPPPLTADSTDRRPMWVKLMPLAMVVLMVGMLAMFALLGLRALTSMLFTIPMMVMMLGMYATQMRGAGGTDDGELEEKIEEYDLLLRERRREIRSQGEALHDLRTLCFPHPADLQSLVGSDQMWQANPDLDANRAVPDDLNVDPAADDSEDPYARNYTGNPYLRARVGIGVAPLYPRLKRAEEVVPEQLEPATMVRYRRAMVTLSVVANLPIDINLAEFPAYALRGAESARLELARSMVMSLAFNHAPSTLNIGVITDDPAAWEWMKWLPHLEDTTRVEKGLGARLLTWRSIDEFAAGHAAVIERMRTTSGKGRPPHLLLIVDTPDQPVSWPLNMAGGVDGMTWLVVRYGSDMVSEERSRILIGSDDRVSTSQDVDAATRDRISVRAAEAFAVALNRYRPAGYGLDGVVADNRPTHVPDFFEALGIGDIETHDIVKVWRKNAYTDEIKVPFGYHRKGDEVLPELSYLNFYEENRGGQGPHGTIQGRTGSGKSYMLRSIVLSLVANYGPDKVALILADFKGGSTFLGMDTLPHVVANISNLKDTAELVDRLGDVLEGEVERREMFIMTERQCKDIFEYRERQQQHPNDPNWPPMPDLIVIIDEFGEFLKKNSRYIKTLDNIGAVGRGLGMHLVMCSQFVDRTLLGDMFNHLAFRYSLAVNDPKHSREMIGTEDAVGPSMSGGSLRGKILRKFNSDVKPVEIVSFRHEDAYVRRSLTQRSRSGGALVTDIPDELVVPFTLIDDRGYTPVIDGEIVDTKEVTTTAKMSDVLLEKIHNLDMPRALDLWQPSLREPLTLLTLAGGLPRENSGLRIRIGDLDAPRLHTRLPWFMDLSGQVPHPVIAGGPKSGRTTLLQTLVISSCLAHSPERAAFFLIDNGTGKLGEVAHSPNVAAYARPGDEDAVYRIIGEAGRLIRLRRTAMVRRGVSSVDAYLEAKSAEAESGDPYGYIVVAIDGIGGFLGSDRELRVENAKKLRTILDDGAAVGVHLVYTADSMQPGTEGNVPQYTMPVTGGVQLPSTSYDGSPLRNVLRDNPAWMPADQPGRSYDLTTQLLARTLVPIPREIEPSRIREGMKVYDVIDYGADIRGLSAWAAEQFAGREVTPVIPAPAYSDYETVWQVFAPLVDASRNPAQTRIPLGWRMDTLELAEVPNFSQNLLVYGERGSGRTNALRMVMESVMREFTPDQASIIVIDPLRHQLSERDRLFARGYINPAVFSGSEEGGDRRRLSPAGYVTSSEDIAETVANLAALMRKRRPGDSTTAEELRDRTYFSGKEVYVFVDNFFALAEGHMAKSVFDEGLAESVSRLLEYGDDLGVHFIVADDNRFSERVSTSPFLKALREKMMTPILQLAAEPSSASPIHQAYHLRPERWRPGQGRLIVDRDNYLMLQTAILDTEAVAQRFPDPVN